MSLSLASNSLSLVSLLLFDRNLDVKILESLHLPLYNARVYWYSYVALFSQNVENSHYCANPFTCPPPISCKSKFNF